MQISTTNSTGSGVGYDSGRDIVTNAHVVGDAKTVQVLPASGTAVLPVDVIGVFKPDDLAVIKGTKDAATLKHRRSVPAGRPCQKPAVRQAPWTKPPSPPMPTCFAGTSTGTPTPSGICSGGTGIGSGRWR